MMEYIKGTQKSAELPMAKDGTMSNKINDGVLGYNPK